MCGIFGWQFKEEAFISERQKVALAVTLSVQNDTRGGDSWGYCALDNGEPVLAHGMQHIIPTATDLAIFNNVFAHTRYATHGTKTIENAHPFDLDGIIGAHNGVIYNHSDLNTKYSRKFSVDSMHIFQHIRDKLKFKELEGYGAIEWFERGNPGRVYLCKLHGGDLSVYYIGSHANPTGVVWSSREDHLTQALKAAKLEGSSYKIDTAKVHYVQGGALYDDRRQFHLKHYRSSFSGQTGNNNWQHSYDDNNYYRGYYGKGSENYGRGCGHRSWRADDGKEDKYDLTKDKETPSWLKKELSELDEEEGVKTFDAQVAAELGLSEEDIKEIDAEDLALLTQGMHIIDLEDEKKEVEQSKGTDSLVEYGGRKGTYMA